MMIIDQEKLVDNIIVNDIIRVYPELKKLIETCSPYEVRGKILSVLDPRNDLHYDYKEFHELNLDSEDLKYLDEIAVTLRNYVRVADTEVKSFGEVMTPISLVDDMLDTLPKEVWSNKDLKWFDPCAGVGTFPSVIVQRLMKGLEKVIPNKNKRYRHIIENMIYVCELQAKNMFIFHCIFDRPNIFELNTFYGSYLSDEFNEHMTNVWGVDKFDIIVMNPPYNSGSNNYGSAHVLWDKFVIKTTHSLTEGGCLVAVHPDGWRNLGNGFNDVKKLLKSKQITYLELHNDVDGQKTFGAQTAFDFYCLHNSPNTTFTKIKFQDGSVEWVDITKMALIPNGMYKSYLKLLAKDGEEMVKILNDSSYHIQKEYVSNERNEEFIYPCVYSILKDGTINLKFSSINSKGHFGIPKVIWSNGGATTPIVDSNGDYGMTQFGFSIVDDIQNLDSIKRAMVHPDFIEMMKYSNGTKQRYNHKIIGLFRKDFYKQFLND